MGGKSATALYTNLFDAAGFTVSAIWNPWASAAAKRGDFSTVLYSQVPLLPVARAVHAHAWDREARAKPAQPAPGREATRYARRGSPMPSGQVRTAGLPSRPGALRLHLARVHAAVHVARQREGAGAEEEGLGRPSSARRGRAARGGDGRPSVRSERAPEDGWAVSRGHYGFFKIGAQPVAANRLAQP